MLSGTRYWMGHLPAAEELTALSTSRCVLRRLEGEHGLLRNHVFGVGHSDQVMGPRSQ
jgi:hypothetical protein